MKNDSRYCLHRLVLQCMLLLVCGFMYAQENIPIERLHVVTDKAHYFGGDTIWMRVLAVDAETGRSICVSKYVYVELVDPFGNSQSRVKIIERDGVLSGYMPISPTIAEGDYNLCAYTLFMNNAGCEDFAYSNVHILSPMRFGFDMKTRVADDGECVGVDVSAKATAQHRLSVVSMSDALYSNDHFDGHEHVVLPKRPRQEYIKVSVDKYSRFVRLPGNMPAMDEGHATMPATIVPHITTDKTSYACRERVTVTVELGDSIDVDGGIVVSVTDDGSAVEQGSALSRWTLGHDQAARQIKTRLGMITDDYPYPLEVGQEIYGCVTNYFTGRPVRGKQVSVISPAYAFVQAVQTDDDGCFSFQGFDFPDSTCFIVKTGLKAHDLRIYEPTTVACRFHAPAYIVDETTTDSIAQTEYVRIAANANLRELLLPEVMVKGVSPVAEQEMVRLLSKASFDNDFIEEHHVTSLEDVLRRIPGMRILDDHAYYRNGMIGYVLDGILYGSVQPTKSAEKGGAQSGQSENRGEAVPSTADLSRDRMAPSIKEMDQWISFEFVRSIDFLPPENAVIYGSRATVGGVLRISTGIMRGGQRRDYPNVVHHTPLGYQRIARFYSPDYAVGGYGGTDLRSTLYWNPCVVMTDGGRATLSFYTNDAPSGTYTLQVQGLTTDGRPVVGCCTLLVNKEREHVD